MRNTLLLLTISVSAIFIFSMDSYAVPPGKKVIYNGGEEGKVEFNGKDHRIRGNSCIQCHPDIFIMKGHIKMTMAEIFANKYCGACHNGTDGFDAKKKENCNRCHK
ncbi:MAG: c(7)-type cytochrome triheme domain-containing protein [Thermodesulfovibrionales bacterium]